MFSFQYPIILYVSNLVSTTPFWNNLHLIPRFVKAGDDPMYSSQYQEISEAQAVSIIQTAEKRSVGVSTG
jgi:hypothetical protein